MFTYDAHIKQAILKFLFRKCVNGNNLWIVVLRHEPVFSPKFVDQLFCMNLYKLVKTTRVQQLKKLTSRR